jgi:hypothetical protein
MHYLAAITEVVFGDVRAFLAAIEVLIVHLVGPALAFLDLLGADHPLLFAAPSPNLKSIQAAMPTRAAILNPMMSGRDTFIGCSY